MTRVQHMRPVTACAPAVRMLWNGDAAADADIPITGESPTLHKFSASLPFALQAPLLLKHCVTLLVLYTLVRYIFALLLCTQLHLRRRCSASRKMEVKPDRLSSALAEVGLSYFRPLQREAITLLLDKKDCVVVVATGAHLSPPSFCPRGSIRPIIR